MKETFKKLVDQTMNESSTMWGMGSGMFGALTVSEWCLLLTAVVTIFNFIKNWYIDMKKLKMLEEEHRLKIKGESNEH